MKPYYEHGGIRIFHGDCREILPRLTGDVIVTDPPYNPPDIGSDHGAPLQPIHPHEWFPSAQAVTMRAVFTPGIGNLWKYPEPKWVAAWWKPSARGYNKLGGWNTWEPILIYGKTPARPIHDSFMATTESIGNGHPCPKPPRLWAWLMSWATAVGETVIDPMVGSGTSLVIAKRLGRKADGIEIEEKYCEIAAKRLSQEVFEFPTMPSTSEITSGVEEARDGD